MEKDNNDKKKQKYTLYNFDDKSAQSNIPTEVESKHTLAKKNPIKKGLKSGKKLLKKILPNKSHDLQEDHKKIDKADSSKPINLIKEKFQALHQSVLKHFTPTKKKGSYSLNKAAKKNESSRDR